MDFDWNDAKAFLRTAETGSLTAAAKQLHASQPTVGRRIAALEKSLGIVLFERYKNGLILTPQGERVVEALQGMEKLANDTILIAQGATESHSGIVTIAVSQIDAVFNLPSLIAELRTIEPSLQIKLKVSNSRTDLIHRDADIAIRHCRPDEETLIIRKLGEMHVNLFGTASLCSALRNSNDDEKQIPIIGFLETDYTTQLLHNSGIAAESLDYVCLSDCQLSQIELAKQGLGLVLLPAYLGSEIDELEFAFTQDYSIYEYDTWLVCHSELRHNKRIRFVYDFLAQRLSR